MERVQCDEYVENVFRRTLLQPTAQQYTSKLSIAHYLLDKGADINARMPPDQSSKGSALEWTGKNGTPEMKALFRKYLAMRVRRCVLGPASEHSRRQMARDLAPEIASFLV